jgi:hypothetical protein
LIQQEQVPSFRASQLKAIEDDRLQQQVLLLLLLLLLAVRDGESPL